MIFVMADAHLQPENGNTGSLENAYLLGKLLLEYKPETIVFLGDFLSMNSLSAWDKDKRLTMEGRRYHEDVAVGRDWLGTFFAGVNSTNQIRKAYKKKQYKPTTIFIEGNHEYRLDRYVQQHPELHGALDIRSDIGIDEVVPDDLIYARYGEVVYRHNIAFTHAPIAANNQPVQGQYALHRALELFDCSVVFGHLHRLETRAVQLHGGTIKRALSAGCMFEGAPFYAPHAVHHNWCGVLMLEPMENGDMDISTFSINKIRSMYC